MLIGTPNSAPSCTCILKKLSISNASSPRSSISGPTVQRMRRIGSDMHRAFLRTRLIGAGDQLYDLPLADLTLIERGDLLAVAQDDDVIGDIDDLLELRADEQHRGAVVAQLAHQPLHV